MLGLFERHTDEPTREGLMKFAERYFYKYRYELTSGTVKGKLDCLIITVSFTVDEEEVR